MTKDGIDDDVKKYLSLGPDFCEAPARVPYEQFVAETEKMCSMIKKEGGVKEIAENIIEREVSEVCEKSIELNTRRKEGKEESPTR